MYWIAAGSAARSRAARSGHCWCAGRCQCAANDVAEVVSSAAHATCAMPAAGSIPAASTSQVVIPEQLTKTAASPAAIRQRPNGPEGHFLAPCDNARNGTAGGAPTSLGDLGRLASAWSFLQPHIREAVSTLLDAGLAAGGYADYPCDPLVVVTNHAIRQIAVGCRQVIQSCLREEEWSDADDEFAAVIAQGLHLNSNGRSGTEQHLQFQGGGRPKG
jgi:hypothetical protein